MKHIYNLISAANILRPTAKALGTALSGKILTFLVLSFFLLIVSETNAQNYNQGNVTVTPLETCVEQRVTLTASDLTGIFFWDYQWQYSSDGVNFQNISRANSTQYEFVAKITNNGEIYRLRYYTGLGTERYTKYSNPLKVNLIPTAPTVTGTTSCEGGRFTLKAAGSTNGNYRWYTSNETLVSNQTNSTYETPNISATTTYLVSIVSNGCESEKVPVTAVVEKTAPTAIGAERVGPGSVTLRAGGAPTGANYLWYTVPTGGTPTTTTTPEFITPSLSQTTKYYVATKTAQGCESARTEVVATITAPSNADDLTTHVILYHENFNGQVAGLSTPSPDRWSLTPTTESTVTNSGKASGGNYIRTNNASTTADRILSLSNNISTLGYQHIGIMWRHRKSRTNNEHVPLLSYSTDGGNTWQQVQSNLTPSTAWNWVNGGSYIILPEDAANKSNVQFRWTITNSPNLNTSFYCIDDITIIGTPTVGLDKFSWSSRPNNEQPFVRSVIADTDDYTVEGLRMEWSVNRIGTTTTTANITNEFQSTPTFAIIQTGANNNNRTEIILNLSSPVNDLTFSLFDIDRQQNQFRDNIEIIGYNGDEEVRLTKRNIIHSYRHAITTTGRIEAVTAYNAADDGLPDGNVTVTFDKPVSSVVIIYRNSGAGGSTQQGIGIHDLMWRTLTIAPLPVELTSFNARRHTQGVQLTWETASELENKGFEVQVSTDARKFTALGFVESNVGTGTTLTRQNYSFLDTKAVSGTRYYRLKQVDFDGTTSFSQVRAVVMNEGNNKVSAYPNPFDDAVVVTLNGTESRNVQVMLMDAMGKVIQQRTEETSGNAITVDTRSITTKGMYVLHVYDNDIKHTFKLMKR